MSEHRRGDSTDGLPMWLNATVVLALLACFVFNLAVYGPDGYPMAVIIGGLLGGYIGADRLVARKREQQREGDGGA